MAEVTSRHLPSWALWPINHNTTAWRDFGLPMVLVVPHRRDTLGNPVDNSGVFNVRIAIEDVPRKTLVAGPEHVGLRVPDRELFARNLSNLEMSERAIDPSGQSFYDVNGNLVDYSEAVYGDLMEYTTTTGVIDRLTYDPTANYYDLSDILIETTEQLSPDYYFLSYNADYYMRKVVDTGSGSTEILCIDTSTVAKAVYTFRINHPGNVIEEMTRLTPGVNLTAEKKEDDSTISFYRPFADALQDVFDEQWFIERMNWVNEISPEHIPYLSFLLGFDLPYFPQSIDGLRRAMLQNVTHLQKLKGSKRALTELFELFGFNVLIANLWWSVDGTKLIKPGDRLPAEMQDQEITTDRKTQIEPILAEYNTDGFGELVIPLLHRPQDNITDDGVFVNEQTIPDIEVVTYLVETDTAAHVALQSTMSAMDSDPSGYGEEIGTLPDSGLDGIIAYSSTILENGIGTIDGDSIGVPPIIAKGLKYTKADNTLDCTFNGAISFTGPNNIDGQVTSYVMYSFAIYTRIEIVVPAVLDKLNSNRFAIQVLTKDGDDISPDVLDFVIDFVFKLKAFHSLLYVIHYNIEMTENYEVTDFCVGGDVQQRYDTDAGMLQVPPAIIPLTGNDECDRDPVSLGYKPADIKLRQRKLSLLPADFAAWQGLDARAGLDADGYLRLNPPIDSDRTSCKFTSRGQDRVTSTRVESRGQELHPGPNTNQTSSSHESNLSESPITDVDRGVFAGPGNSNNDSGGYGSFTREYADPRDVLCALDGQTDYCYKGRVDDEILYRQAAVLPEIVRFKQCQLGMGTGVYYTIPSPSVVVKSRPTIFSGGTTGYGQHGHLQSVQGAYLSVDYNEPLPNKNQSYLGRLFRAYDSPVGSTLHYTNRPLITAEMAKQKNMLALTRPSLNIEMPTMHLPGCRFITMGSLQRDFEHPAWRARPWDDAYSLMCGTVRGGGVPPTWLNAELVINTDGDETLEFDDVPFTVVGNGLSPDIRDLSGETMSASISATLSTSEIATDLIDDLVAYYPLDEASGLRYDMYSNNDLTPYYGWPSLVEGGVTQQVGQMGYAAGFSNAIGSYLSGPNADVNFSGSFTVAFWFYMTSTGTSLLASNNAGYGGDIGWFIRKQGATVKFFVTNTDGNTVVASTPATIATNTWYFLVCEYDVAGEIAITFNNGVRHATAVIPLNMLQISDSKLYLGTFDGSALGLTGRIDEFAAWNRLLTTDEKTYLGAGGVTFNSIFSTSAVVHSVYMEQVNGHEAITLDQSCSFPTDVDSDGTMIVFEPLFGSAVDCGATDVEYRDYVNGYACTYGEQEFESPDFGRGGLFDDLLEAIGLVITPGTDDHTLLFTLSSGIRDSTGYRLDCSCTVVGCAGTDGIETLSCATDLYREADGTYDWNPDHLETESNLIFDEPYGAHSYSLDGQIETLLEMFT